MLRGRNKPMLPALACSNSPKMVVTKAILSCGLAGAYQTRLQAVNQLNWHGSRMMVFPALVKPPIRSVFHIAHLRIPSKICNAVVCWIAIVMARKFICLWFAHKSRQHKPRNKSSELFLVDAKPHSHVAAPIVLSQQTPLVLLSHSATSQSRML